MASAYDLDIEAAIQALGILNRIGERSISKLAEAVSMVAFKGERQAKIAATDLIYSQAERGYSRTGTLRRSIMAASPDYAHDSDEGDARGGTELSGGEGLSVVKVTPTAIESMVGSWVSYAEFVNDGTSYMDARPFLDQGLETLEEDLEEFTMRALGDILNELSAA